MKKGILTVMTALCLFGAADAYGQRGYHSGRPHRPDYSYYGRNGIELSVGYLHSNYRHKDFTKESTDRDKGLDGMYVGVTKDFFLVRRALAFQTGVTYGYQNASNRFKSGTAQIVSDRNEHYLDIPMRIKFAMDVMPNLRAFVYAGPTMNFGLSSKYQCRAKLSENEVGRFTYNYYNGKTKVNTIPDFVAETPSSVYRRFDIDMGFALGAEIYDIAVVKLGFDWGLINKNKNRNVADYLVTHRNTFYLGLGVRF